MANDFQIYSILLFYGMNALYFYDINALEVFMAGGMMEYDIMRTTS